MEITQEQIEQLREVGNEKTKKLLGEWFGIKIEPHVWYYWEGYLAAKCFFAYSDVDKKEIYGFRNGEWFRYSVLGPKHDFRLATQEEVEPLLISEAKKRGYKNGNYECLSEFGTKVIDDEDMYKCYFGCKLLWQGGQNGNQVYMRGKWAEIIPTMTIEEAEKKLNCRIIK